MSFTSKDEVKNIEIKLKPIQDNCPGRGKMAINLVEAKFTDTTKQARKIKCTRNPLKLIIKEEGEKKEKGEKAGTSSEKPTNLFQNILKNTKFKLPKKLTAKKVDVKEDVKKEIKKVQKVAEVKETITKPIQETKQEIIAQPQETQKIQETTPPKVNKLPLTTPKPSSNIISKVFNDKPQKFKPKSLGR